MNALVHALVKTLVDALVNCMAFGGGGAAAVLGQSSILRIHLCNLKQCATLKQTPLSNAPPLQPTAIEQTTPLNLE
jgi:hypothetical protein